MVLFAKPLPCMGDGTGIWVLYILINGNTSSLRALNPPSLLLRLLGAAAATPTVRSFFNTLA